MPIAHNQGVAIQYHIHGEGEPIVLLHGFASSFDRNWLGTGWVGVLNRAGYQTLGLDLRGHGASDKPREAAAYAVDRLSDDVLAVMDHAGWPRAALMGFSMGGGLAIHLAERAPSRVSALIAGGIGDPLLRGHAQADEVEHIAQALAAPEAASVTHPRGKQFRTFADATHNDRNALTALMRGPGWPAEITGASLSCPMLIVTAENDEIMTGSAALRLAYPAAEFVAVPGRSHNSLVGDPRYKAAGVAFLDRFVTKRGLSPDAAGAGRD